MFMEFNLITNIENCYLDIPGLLYYSHIPTAALAFLIGFFVYLKNKNSLDANILFLTTLFFSLWVIGDIVLWTSPDSRQVMFVWSIINLAEMLVSATTLYFAYVFLEKKDVAFRYKIFVLGFLLPFVFLIPTSTNVEYFDTAICEAVQGPMIRYLYAVETILVIWLAVYLGKKILSARNFERKPIVLFTIGITAFLLSFSGANVVASLSEHWEILQYGLLGTPVFVTFLAYLIVRYQAFSIRVIGAEVLVVGILLLIGSQFFFLRTSITIVLNSITLFLAALGGVFLIREVKKEVERKEELEALTSKLSVANTELKRLDSAKSEFISIASHQLRTPLTAIRGFLDLLLEGAYGTIEPKVKDTLGKLTIANNRLMSLVENLLNISRIEAGRIQYQFAPTHIEDIVNELEDMFVLAAKEKGLSFVVKHPRKPLPLLSLDATKIRETISNLIDNAMKYTTEGSVTLSYDYDAEHVRVMITDTGMGIDPKDLVHIFKKFERGTGAEKINVSSTGLGLYVGQKFAEAHGGTIRAESAGRGKGSRFILELPVHVVEKVKQLPQA